jgi:hypothetical protein
MKVCAINNVDALSGHQAAASLDSLPYLALLCLFYCSTK